MKVSGEVKVFGGLVVVAGILVVVTVLPSLIKREPTKDPLGPTIINSQKVTAERLVPADAHIMGPVNAKYTLVVFSDFECPQCKASAPAVDSAVKKKGDLRMVYRHFKARPEHINSALLAQAAEAAGFQGKFWEMHDALFENQLELKESNQDNLRVRLSNLAEKLKLDVKKFQADLMSDKAAKAFQRDMELGIDAEVPGTPTYYILRPNKPMVRMSQQSDIASALGDLENYTVPVQPGDPAK